MRKSRFTESQIVSILKDGEVVSHHAAREAVLLVSGERPRAKFYLAPRSDLAPFPPPLDQAMHPRPTHAVFGSDLLGLHPRIPIRQHARPQIHRVRGHAPSRGRGTMSAY